MPILTNQNESASQATWSSRLRGWLGRWTTERQKQAVEDLLKHVHASEARGQGASAESVAGALGWKLRDAIKMIAKVEAGGLLRSTAKGLVLTEEGEHLAISVIRAHRLWERYLADEAGMSLTHVHAEANRLEHQRSGDRVDQLDAALGYPSCDPHGDPIPTADGKLVEATGTPLTNWPVGQAGRVVHLEDEPRSVFDQIVALGLRVGQVIEVNASTTEELEVVCDGRHGSLAPIIAANVFVQSMPQVAALREPTRRLHALDQGESAVIHGFDDNLRGFHRRRLLDLGLTPGTSIRAERVSMFRDPVAYRVRGSLVALRREQAQSVLIENESS